LRHTEPAGWVRNDTPRVLRAGKVIAQGPAGDIEHVGSDLAQTAASV
jgi:hypothetical protein